MAISKIDGTGLSSGLTGVTLTSPVLTTPNLGTPSTLVLTNATSLPKAALPAGTVVQVVQYVIPGSSYTTFTGFNTNTQIQGSITPTSASSKILVTMNYNIGTATTSLAMCTAQITRNGTSVFSIGQIAGNVVSTRSLQNVSHTYLDSPNTTSSTAYRLQVNSVDGATCYIGGWGYAPADWNSNCVLTLMEITA
jgi:hypothetical protein